MLKYIMDINRGEFLQLQDRYLETEKDRVISIVSELTGISIDKLEEQYAITLPDSIVPDLPMGLSSKQQEILLFYHYSILEYYAVLFENEEVDTEAFDKYAVDSNHYNLGAILFQDFINELIEITGLDLLLVNRSLVRIFFEGEEGDWLLRCLDEEKYRSIRNSLGLLNLNNENFSLLQLLLAKQSQNYHLEDLYSYQTQDLSTDAAAFYDPNQNKIFYSTRHLLNSYIFPAASIGLLASIMFIAINFNDRNIYTNNVNAPDLDLYNEISNVVSTYLGPNAHELIGVTFFFLAVYFGVRNVYNNLSFDPRIKRHEIAHQLHTTRGTDKMGDYIQFGFLRYRVALSPEYYTSDKS